MNSPALFDNWSLAMALDTWAWHSSDCVLLAPRGGAVSIERGGLMASRRPETMAKRAREQAVKEKRERKHERKQAAAAARLAGDTAPAEDFAGEPGSDESAETDDGAGTAANETAVVEQP
jgi:hypothetical protein